MDWDEQEILFKDVHTLRKQKLLAMHIITG